MTDEIKNSLVRRGIDDVCHMTPCDRLASIFTQGGLLSRSERGTRGILEPEEPHFWGSVGKEEELADFVICSFMPPWWMCRRRKEELAIVVLDAAVCTVPETRFCPHNSAYSEFPAEDIKNRNGIEGFDECFQNPLTYQAGDAEIFVSQVVPISMFRGIVFCDEEAKDYWLPLIQRAFDALPDGTAIPDKIPVAVRGVNRFHFPGDFHPSVRFR